MNALAVHAQSNNQTQHFPLFNYPWMSRFATLHYFLNYPGNIFSHSHLYCTPVPHFYRAGFADKVNQDVANTLVTGQDSPSSVTIKGKFPFRNGVIVPIL